MPEVKRYGGRLAINEAFKHFHESSIASMCAFKLNVRWNSDIALGIGLRMHVGFIHAAGLSLDEATILFTQIFNTWLPSAIQLVLQQGKTGNSDSSELIVRDLFRTRFESQKAVLVPYFLEYWTSLGQRVRLIEPWLNRWWIKNREICLALRALCDTGKLRVPFQRPNYKTLINLNKIGQIYESYIHMTNNRLGIINGDESYLAYLIIRLLENAPK